MHATRRTATLIVCLATSILVTLGGAPTAAAAEDDLELLALTGPAGGDVTLTVPAENGGAGVASYEHVKLRLIAPAGSDRPQRILSLKDVPAQNGRATIDLDPLERGTAVVVQAHVREETPPRTRILRGATITLLRPDLVVTALHAPPQTLSTRPVDIVADVAELNTDSGARATVTLMLGPTPVSAPKTVTVAAGGTSSVTFEQVALTSPMTARVTARVEAAAPYETDETNNARSLTVEVTEHELVRTNVLVDALGGYGAQFNQHVYAAITPKPSGSLPDLEQKVKDLEPQLVRIFFHEVQERDPDQLASFYETVELAQATGAAINITYHTAANARFNPDRFMRDFAVVLENLVEVRGFDNVRWVTIQNEVNATNVTPLLTAALYRELPAAPADRGLRDRIGLMGGDLVENGGNVPLPNHIPWWTYMAEHMSDVLDAYSVHIYWNYWDIPRMAFRLRNVRAIVDGPILAGARKPVFVTEFGVRGIQNIPGSPAIQPGYWEDGTPLSRTNIVAFQHLWFDIAAAQLGYSGAVKWDAYWGRYTPGYRETYNLIGPAEEGWPLFPAYHALRMLFQTTARGWQVIRIDPWADDDWRQDLTDPPEKELVAFAGADGALTVAGLDSHGRDLNTASPDAPEYSIGGLPPNTSLGLALWNASGDGKSTVAAEVETNAAGVARFSVPLHAAFALTNVPVS
jgi:hypothetical protein